MKRTVLYTTATGVLVDATVIAYAQARHTQGGPQWLATLLLGCGGFIAVAAAAGAAFGAAWTTIAARRFERHLAMRDAMSERPPSQRYRSRQDPIGVEYDELWAAERARAAAEEQAHAAAMAAVAADAPLPERAVVRVEAVRPLPATKPLPTVDVAAVLPQPVPYAVRWAFDADGARTVVPEAAGRAA